ncbi:methyltransferase domain-containing protein [Clostridium sp. BJN0001]|uniref:methyltransferase domain-containing protein n=1 Tax=Clostridium sp. BJN0001 TaxID=2930219 RepID=UPI001FD02EF0|nr:methyltransferase domain-containing protein [Clostridium sp. BJN0001]
MSKYDFDLDLDSSNTMSIIIKIIKPKSKILEFGPANGRLTKYLKNSMNCCVDIVEIDNNAGKEASQYSNKSFIGLENGDIEKYIWLDSLKNEKYDYIIFADVLEHLRNPQKVLFKCKKVLNDNGAILMSVPNIAHNSVIIDLLNNEFKYNKLGLLDNTHIRFFTIKSLLRMIDEAGYIATIQKALYSGVGTNEIVNTYNDVDRQISKELKKRKYGELYQFVFEIRKKEIIQKENINIDINLENRYSYKTMCYIMEDNDEQYSDDKSKTILINPKNSNELCFNLSDYKKIKQLRFDPLTCNCIIKINKIYGFKDDEEIDVKITTGNGLKIYDNIYIFNTEDPQINLKIVKNIDKLVIDCNFIDFDCDIIGDYYKLFCIIGEDYDSQIHKLVENYDTKIKLEEEKISKAIEEKNKNVNLVEEQNKKIEMLNNILDKKTRYIKDIEESRGWKLLCKFKSIFNK